jgi:23S rRNA (cytidine1920-2'-O)/16S rRNA (cytidine1409-2'-O)-methyltransferase
MPKVRRAKIRLDVLLVERGLVESRALAQRMVMAGQVRVNGQVAAKPAAAVLDDVEIEIERSAPFVSRGGEKLQAALLEFGLAVDGLVCADVGASTGGFTDCLLQNGAAKVYAIDVGQGILHWKLRQDVRVVVMEKTNARFLDRLPEAVDLVTVDASFISLKLLLPVVKGWLRSVQPGSAPLNGTVVPLVKPQFEAGRSQVSRGHGVIRDETVHRQVLLDVLNFAQEEGYSIRGLMQSPLFGPKGNMEFLAWLEYPVGTSLPVETLIDETLASNG